MTLPHSTEPTVLPQVSNRDEYPIWLVGGAVSCLAMKACLEVESPTHQRVKPEGVGTEQNTATRLKKIAGGKRNATTGLRDVEAVASRLSPNWCIPTTDFIRGYQMTLLRS